MLEHTPVQQTTKRCSGLIRNVGKLPGTAFVNECNIRLSNALSCRRDNIARFRSVAALSFKPAHACFSCQCRRMLKFLNFVAQDDRPILTPPSEDESEQLAVEEDSEGHQDNESGDFNTEKKADNLKDDIAAALRNVDELKISDERSHQSHPLAFTSETICNREQERARQGSQSRMAFSPEESGQASGPLDGAADSVVHQSAECKSNSGEPVFSPSRSQMSTQVKRNFHRTSSETPKHRRSRPKVRELLSRSDDRLRSAARVLSSFASDGIHKQWKSRESRLRGTQEVVSALREIAETMVWADQHEPSLWDTFMECSVMRLLHRCLCATVPSNTGAGNTSVEGFDGASTLERRKRSESGHQRPNGTHPTTHTQAVQSDTIARRKNTISPPKEDSMLATSPPSAREAVPQARHSSASEGSTGALVSNEIDQLSNQIALETQSQVLQSLSIMIQSIFRQHSLLCLFSSNHINEILSFRFRFEDDEMLGYFMSAVKTIALKLDRGLLQLFFDPSRRLFPLYTTVVRFFDHREQMVRIAVRNVTLTIYSLGDPQALAFAAQDESMYFIHTVDLLAKLCGSVARAFELLMDDGREVSRTRTRTGIFLRKVRKSDVTGKLEEIENLFAYLGDVASISRSTLRPLILQLLSAKLFAPLFRPIASRASPKAVQFQKRWRLTNMTADKGTSALHAFDAGARCLLLASVLEICRPSCLALGLIRELCWRAPEFENRAVLHALKAMASDTIATERVTFVSLCAIEAFILCGATTRETMMSFKYGFGSRNSADSLNAADLFRTSFASGEYSVEEEKEENLEEPLLMTLLEFEAPLTPSNSIPSTPSYVPPSPSDGATPPKDLTRVMSAASLSTDDLAVQEGSDSEGALFTSQLGESSLREVLLSIVLAVRRREVRTLRILHAVCRILDAVGSKTGSFKLCVEFAKLILNEIACVMHSFLRNKRTTIVSIERMFDNFRSVAAQEVSERCSIVSLDKILSPDAVPRIAEELPKGAGKRRRSRKDNVAPPTETEDAVVLFVMLYAYERAQENHDKVEMFPGTTEPNRSKTLLSTEVRETLLECSVDESYLDKREALESVASSVLRYRP